MTFNRQISELSSSTSSSSSLSFGKQRSSERSEVTGRVNTIQAMSAALLALEDAERVPLPEITLAADSMRDDSKASLTFDGSENSECSYDDSSDCRSSCGSGRLLPSCGNNNCLGKCGTAMCRESRHICPALREMSWSRWASSDRERSSAMPRVPSRVRVAGRRPPERVLQGFRSPRTRLPTRRPPERVIAGPRALPNTIVPTYLRPGNCKLPIRVPSTGCTKQDSVPVAEKMPRIPIRLPSNQRHSFNEIIYRR